MLLLLKIIKIFSLVLIIIPPLLLFGELCTLDTVKWVMLGGTIGWFITASISQKLNG